MRVREGNAPSITRPPRHYCSMQQPREQEKKPERHRCRAETGNWQSCLIFSSGLRFFSVKGMFVAQIFSNAATNQCLSRTGQRKRESSLRSKQIMDMAGCRGSPGTCSENARSVILLAQRLPNEDSFGFGLRCMNAPKDCLLAHTITQGAGRIDNGPTPGSPPPNAEPPRID